MPVKLTLTIIACLSLSLISESQTASRWYINTSNGEKGFIDKKGKTVIPFEKNVRYDYRGFRRGLVQGKRSIYDESNRFSGYYELFYIDKKGVKIWSDILKQ